MKQKAVDKKKTSKGLKERVHEHLTNKNDIITDEDLKNIKVGEEAFDEEPGAKRELEEDLKDEKKLADAVDEKKVTSPWNILTEDDK